MFDTDIYPYHALLSQEILTFPATSLVAFFCFQVLPSVHIIDHQEASRLKKYSLVQRATMSSSMMIAE